MGRKACREYTMILLYQLEIQKDNREEQIERFFAENGSKCDDKEYMTDVLNGVHSHEKEIDSIIEEYSRGWKLSRISKVDLSILRLSVYEMLWRDDIPPSVSINEAVELAKKYSSKEAGAFVNGILGNIAANKRKSDKNTGEIDGLESK